MCDGFVGCCYKNMFSTKIKAANVRIAITRALAADFLSNLNPQETFFLGILDVI